MYKNLKILRESLGMTQKEFAASLSIGLTTYNGYETGARDPKSDFWIAVAQKYGITIDYLMGYSDDPHSIGNEAKKIPLYSSEAMQLAKDYDDLDGHGQRVIRLLADEEHKRCIGQAKEKTKMEAAAELAGDMMDHIIPFRRSYQPASAGTGMYLGPDEFETIYVQENELTRRASFGVPVSGDSMEPDYHDGDVLLVERAEDIKIGEVGVFTINGEGYVKERGQGELISLNPTYDPIPMNESIFCSGRVIGVLEPDWIVEG